MIYHIYHCNEYVICVHDYIIYIYTYIHYIFTKLYKHSILYIDIYTLYEFYRAVHCTKLRRRSPAVPSRAAVRSSHFRPSLRRNGTQVVSIQKVIGKRHSYGKSQRHHLRRLYILFIYKECNIVICIYIYT